jgi:acyl-CoA synthetase (AMP-forming)/AMP-acid ligase II
VPPCQAQCAGATPQLASHGRPSAHPNSGAALYLVVDKYAHHVNDKPKMAIKEAIREDEMKDAPADKPGELVAPDDGCYVIYTSGTTKKPKGVDIWHRGVSNGMCFRRLRLQPVSDASSSHFGLSGQCRHAACMRVSRLLYITSDMGAW